jgi:hypothetical protein
VPLVVITPAAGSVTPTSLARRELLRKLAESSALGTQISADQSGHMVHMDQPALVSKVVADVVARVRQVRQ